MGCVLQQQTINNHRRLALRDNNHPKLYTHNGQLSLSFINRYTIAYNLEDPLIPSFPFYEKSVLSTCRMLLFKKEQHCGSDLKKNLLRSVYLHFYSSPSSCRGEGG